MKILFSSQHFWPENFPTNDLAQALVERGLEVDVLTGKPNCPQGRIFPGYRGSGCQRESWSGISVFRVPLVARGSGSAARLALNYLSFIVSGLVCAPWLLMRRQYSVILVYGSSPILQALPALFLGWLKRCPVIIWVQDLWPDSLQATGYVHNPRFLKTVEYVVRFIYRHADLLLVQSRAFESPVARLASGTPIAYYPNSVDAVFCAQQAGAVPEISALSSGFPVVFAGNIGTAQAVEVIIEAAALLRDQLRRVASDAVAQHDLPVAGHLQPRKRVERNLLRHGGRGNQQEQGEADALHHTTWTAMRWQALLR